MNNNTDLHWVHERSALVGLMLQEGYSYILCEGSYCDKDFDKFDGNVVVIVDYTENGFEDTNGDLWNAVQPIKPDGSVMTYDDYLKLKQLREVWQ